jgi:hypothetical protein
VCATRCCRCSSTTGTKPAPTHTSTTSVRHTPNSMHGVVSHLVAYTVSNGLLHRLSIRFSVKYIHTTGTKPAPTHTSTTLVRHTPNSI